MNRSIYWFLYIFLVFSTIIAATDNNIITIPCVVFRSFDDKYSELHLKFHEVFSNITSQNADCVIVYFDGKDREHFISTYYKEYLSAYRSLIPGTYKSDVFRYLVVYKYGGIYNDMGIRYTAPILEIFKADYEFVTAVDIIPSNLLSGFFGAYPRHPLLRELITLVMDNIHYQRYGCSNLDITGPQSFGRAFHTFINYKPDSLAIKTGKHVLKGHKFYFYQFDTSNSITDHSTGKEVVHNKFPGYHQAIYKNNTPVYGEQYTNRHVYNNSYLSKEIQDKVFRYEGNLVQRNREIWYVIDDKRHPFEDYDVFKDIGFEHCMVKNNNDPNIGRIPIGKPLTENLTETLQAIKSIIFQPHYLDTPNSAMGDVQSVVNNMQRVIEKFKGRVIMYNEFIEIMESDMSSDVALS